MKKMFLAALMMLCLATSACGAMSDAEFLDLCEKGSVQEIQTALLKGANPNAKDENGWTPLMAVASFNQNPKAVSVLLKAGADVNAKDDNDSTALMYAAKNAESHEALFALMKAGADVNAKDKDGMTVLDYAQQMKNDSAIKVLKAAGAK